MNLTISPHALDKLDEMQLPLRTKDVIRALSPDIIQACQGKSGKGWVKLVQFNIQFSYWRTRKISGSNNARSYQRSASEIRVVNGVEQERCKGDSLWAIVNVDKRGIYVKTFLIRESNRKPRYENEWVKELC